MNVTFITGNQKKADLFAAYMGKAIQHKKLDLEEIQSLKLEEVVEHKAKQAYEIIKSPVLVEDVGLTLDVFNGLPGPFVKWFEQEIGLSAICKLLDNYDDRGAQVSVCFAYFDGSELKLFRGDVRGTISKSVRDGPSNFGWNPIFIPSGHDKTYAEMNNTEWADHGFRESTVYPLIKKFLATIDKS